MSYTSTILKPSLPSRIVCLTEETTETLYLLGAEDLIVGISGFTVRPKIARKTKPKVSTYLDANIQEIVDLKPDVVLAWSDLQADICAALIREGIEVICFNQRSVQGIISMMYRLGVLVGKTNEVEKLIEQIQNHLELVRVASAKLPFAPKVYFEEWYEPLISGICWVSELIEWCGGIDVCAENRHFPDAKRRIIASTDVILEKNPEILIASWCGKAFKPQKVLDRPGWAEMSAVKNQQLHEIHSSIILQPGPAVLTDGLTDLQRIIHSYVYLC